jgi:hypothetical protein
MATVLSPPEQRVTLHNVSWQTYEQILANYADSSDRVVTGQSSFDVTISLAFLTGTVLECELIRPIIKLALPCQPHDMLGRFTTAPAQLTRLAA